MSLLEALDVADARSCFSQRKVDQPRPTASRAMPHPLIPPPMTAISNGAVPLGAAKEFNPVLPKPARGHFLCESRLNVRKHRITNVVHRASEKNEHQNEYTIRLIRRRLPFRRGRRFRSPSLRRPDKAPR